MKTKLNFVFVVLTILASAYQLGAQSTAFTYQGRLNNNGSVANGNYDFQFMLFNVYQAGSSVGPVLMNSAVLVTNGLFTTSIDFGAGVFTGTNLWLDISVRTNGNGAFSELAPRQPLTPTPYAVFANTASNLSGTLPTTQLPDVVVTNNETSINLNGTFSGDGSGLHNTVTAANYVSAYDTTSHTVSVANTFQGVTFTATSVNGWTYFGGAGATFTCNQLGIYFTGVPQTKKLEPDSTDFRRN